MNNTKFIDSDIQAYSQSVNDLRAFFLLRGFVEVHTQDRLSILAACEDPSTVATYTYAGQVWPLPQTGQMWLEYELLTRPDVPGVFCVSTSYRQEPNPIPGRHKLIFPMFEFESRGNLNDLEILEAAVLEHLGYGKATSFPRINYEDAAKQYGVDDITSQIELRLAADYGRAVFLKNFPEKTSPFWNMRRDNQGRACKIDVILDGMETIGSAERSCDPAAMRKSFYAISQGGYSQKLFELFGQSRVEAELEDFLTLPFVPRYGAGIGMTRLMRSQSLFPVTQKLTVTA